MTANSQSSYSQADDRLDVLLERLARELTLEKEEEIAQLFNDALSYRRVARLPVVVSCPAPPEGEIAPYPHSQAVTDPAMMLFNELVSAWGTSIVRRREVGDDLPVTVRANFGTVLVASCFGAPVEQPGDDPAWVRHFESRVEFVAAMGNEIDVTNGASSLVARAVEFMEYYHAKLSEFPPLDQIIKITIPDLQGPLDNSGLLRGSEIFLDIVTDPELFALALGRVAEVQIDLWKLFNRHTKNEVEKQTHQHGVAISGNILLRNDSTILVSPDRYIEAIGPWDQHVLAAVGGGAIHSCGSFEHQVKPFLDLPSIKALDFGESEKNDVDLIYEMASTRKIPLLRIRVSREELVKGDVTKRFPTGVVLIHDAGSPQEARRTMEGYFAASDI